MHGFILEKTRNIYWVENFSSGLQKVGTLTQNENYNLKSVSNRHRENKCVNEQL